MNYLLPNGIGDSVWALHKIQSIAAKLGDPRINVWLSCPNPKSDLETRAVDFVRRFSFINSVGTRPYRIVNDIVIHDGYWNYIMDGRYRFDDEDCIALIPNAPLERGIRLENWLPQHAINWDIFKDFRISWWDRTFGKRLKSRLGRYAVFYLGPLGGNTFSGHNRGLLWKPTDWIELGRRLHSEFNLQIVVVGAKYDSSYNDILIQPLLDGASSYWTNLIGKTDLGELYAVTSNAEFVISYQSGVGIVSTYLGTPTGIFWREKGNSIVPDGYLSFEESMASAWVPPSKMDNHLPLIYGRHDVAYVVEKIKERGWIR